MSVFYSHDLHALAEASVDLYTTTVNKKWHKCYTGKLLLVEDYRSGCLFFRMYDFNMTKLLWEHETSLLTKYVPRQPLFHIIHIMGHLIFGLQFHEEVEAAKFSDIVEKIMKDSFESNANQPGSNDELPGSSATRRNQRRSLTARHPSNSIARSKRSPPLHSQQRPRPRFRSRSSLRSPSRSRQSSERGNSRSSYRSRKPHKQNSHRSSSRSNDRSKSRRHLYLTRNDRTHSHHSRSHCSRRSTSKRSHISTSSRKENEDSATSFRSKANKHSSKHHTISQYASHGKEVSTRRTSFESHSVSKVIRTVTIQDDNFELRVSVPTNLANETLVETMQEEDPEVLSTLQSIKRVRDVRGNEPSQKKKKAESNSVSSTHLRSELKSGMQSKNRSQNENVRTVSLSSEQNLDQKSEERIKPDRVNVPSGDSETASSKKIEMEPEIFVKPAPPGVKKSSQPISRMTKKDESEDGMSSNYITYDSGDSQCGTSLASIYKNMLLDLTEFVRMSSETPEKTLVLNTSQNPSNNLEGFNTVMSSSISDHEFLLRKELTGKTIVPLFHGVPFIQGKHTESKRAKIINFLKECNSKLCTSYRLGTRESPLSEHEKTMIGLNSQTALKKVNLMSQFDLILANRYTLDEIKKVNEQLYQLVKDADFSKDIGPAIKDNIFNYERKTDIPIIEMSKAPDHAIRFACGMDVTANKRTKEGNKATELLNAVKPKYDKQGYPRHRLVGLLYVTAHKLSDLTTQRKDHLIVDVNYSIKMGEIEEGHGFTRYKHQHEIDFLGKINSDIIVAVIPVVYPHVRENGEVQSDYIEDIFGVSPRADARSLLNSKKLREKLANSPDIMNQCSHITGAGRVIMPTYVELAHSVLSTFAKSKGYRVCLINGANCLEPYPLDFDDKTMFSEAQKALRKHVNATPEKRLWELVALKLYKEELKETKNSRGV